MIKILKIKNFKCLNIKIVVSLFKITEVTFLWHGDKNTKEESYLGAT